MASAVLRAQISELSLVISRQKQLLDDMQTRLRDLRTQLNSIPYPVLTLPPEITSEIFFHCLLSEQEWSGVRDMDVVPPLLMCVCKHWRQIAVSTPALWATFQIKIDTEDELPRLAEIAELWLARAGKGSLSIDIDRRLVTSADNFDMLDTLRYHWREISSLRLWTDMPELERLRTRYGSAFDFV